jgi:hypothetical protein
MQQAVSCGNRSFAAVPFVDDSDGNDEDNKNGERGVGGEGGRK